MARKTKLKITQSYMDAVAHISDDQMREDIMNNLADALAYRRMAKSHRHIVKNNPGTKVARQSKFKAKALEHHANKCDEIATKLDRVLQIRHKKARKTKA